MSNIVIADVEGECFQNTGSFTMVEPSRQTRFEPGVIVKVTPNDWIKGQPVLSPVADPMKPAKKAS